MAQPVFVPLFDNGKRDKARRYIDEATGELISRRQYDQKHGRIRGSTNERQAKHNRQVREQFVKSIAAKRGDDWSTARMMPEYLEMLELLKYRSDQTGWESLTSRSTQRKHRDIWSRKLRIGEYFDGEMSADDWHALMSPDSIY